MKKHRPCRTAYIKFRVLVAFTLFLPSDYLSVTAFGSWSGLSLATWIAAHTQNKHDAKLNLKTRKSGGASKNTVPNNSGGSAPAPATSAAQSGYGEENRVTEHRNALGQTVYSIS